MRPYDPRDHARQKLVRALHNIIYPVYQAAGLEWDVTDESELKEIADAVVEIARAAQDDTDEG